MKTGLQAAGDRERLEDFFDYLRAQRFATGIKERVRAHRVLELAGKDAPLERVRRLLGPVIARDADEQDRFRAAFDLFFGDPLTAHVPEWKAGTAPIAPPEQSAPRRMRVRWKPAALAIAATLLFAALLYYNIPERVREAVEPPVVRPPEVQPATGTGGRPIEEKRQEDTIRACNGLECVTRGWRKLSVLSPLAVWLCYEIFLGTLYHRRRQVSRRRREKSGPLEWPIRAHAGSIAEKSRGFHTAARLLGRRLTGDRRVLDVPATVEATARRAGFTDLRFRLEPKPPEYLFLIERRCARDHLASWFEALADGFESQGVRLQRWRFKRDPRRCQSPRTGEYCSLARLAELRGQDRLVLFTEGDGLVSRFGGGLAQWISGRFFPVFEAPVVLTPVPPFQWGAREAALRSRFRLLPARLGAEALLANHFESPERAREDRVPSDEDYPIPPERYFELPAVEGGWVRPPLAAMLDPEVFQWLCACALHSELRWELTLRLGHVVDPSGRLLREPKLLQLIRLPWFRDGSIPREWRQRLIQCLDGETERSCRREIIRLMEHDRAPVGSLAYDWQSAAIAAQQYWLEPESEARRAELEEALVSIPSSEIAQDAVLTELVGSWRAETGKAGGTLGSFQRRIVHSARWRTAAAVLSMIAITVLLFRVQVPDRIEVTTTRIVPDEPAAPTPEPQPDNPPPAAPVQPSVTPAPVQPANPVKVFVPPVYQGTRPAAPDFGEAPAVPSLQVTLPTGGLQQAVLPPPPQTGGTPGTVSGHVLASSGGAIPAVRVTLQQIAPQGQSGRGGTYSSATDGEGRYQIAAPPGRYTLSVVVPRFETGSEVVELSLNQALNHDFLLKLSTGSFIHAQAVDEHYRYIEDARITVRQGKQQFREDQGEFGPLSAGNYDVELSLPSGGKKKSESVRVLPTQTVAVTFRVTADPKKVRKVEFPAYQNLPPDLRAVLEGSTRVVGREGRSGQRLYEQLADRERAELLNLYAKMRSVSCLSNRDCFAFVQSLREVRSDRFFATVSNDAYDVAKNAVLLGRFSPVSAALHTAPAGYDTLGSFRTSDSKGSLQLTFFSNGKEFVVDADIDRSTGALRVIGNVLTGGEDPYNIHMILAEQNLDTLYRLVPQPGSESIDVATEYSVPQAAKN